MDSHISPARNDEGRVAAIAGWVLYLLSIPSANILVIVGLLVAYASRNTATGLPLQHINEQIRLFWSIFWWSVALWIAIAISALLSVLLIGIPFLILFSILLFLVSLWFTVKSAIALINLLGDRPA
jgi:uncharacterized membrane protein